MPKQMSPDTRVLVVPPTLREQFQLQPVGTGNAKQLFTFCFAGECLEMLVAPDEPIKAPVAELSAEDRQRKQRKEWAELELRLLFISNVKYVQ